jgi:hypothetical protein
MSDIINVLKLNIIKKGCYDWILFNYNIFSNGDQSIVSGNTNAVNIP